MDNMPTPEEILAFKKANFGALLLTEEEIIEKIREKRSKANAPQATENRRGLQPKPAIVTKIRELSVTSEYADEERSSSCGYPSGYKPQPIPLQVARLKKLFPELENATYNVMLSRCPLPPNAERWYAIPRWEVLAGTYNDAVQKVLDLIKKDRKDNFYNCLKGKLGEQHLRQTARAIRFWKQLGEEQTGHDILIVAAQFGLRHRGRSVRRARAVFTDNEFGLGAFAVGFMILINPDRLKNVDDLWIDCADDEYSPGADGDFSHAPFFYFHYFHDGRVGFDADWVGYASEHYGSASALLPQ